MKIENSTKSIELFLALLLLSAGSLAMADQPVNDGFQVATTDWPWWRGPHRNGQTSSDQTPPQLWSETENIAWKSPIAGRGYGSPIVFGDRVVLVTSDEKTGSQSIVCLDRQSGKQRWVSVIHASGGMRKNSKATAASITPAWDGERLIVNFANSDALIATAVDIDGNQLWQRDISKYVEHQGYGSSPTVYQDLVFINADNKGGGAIAALNRRNGEVVWRRERPNKPNYPSPVVLNVAGRDQLILIGCDQTLSLEPLTGKTLWESEGATTECVTSTVTDGQRIFTSGGYPKNHISAVRADGSAKIEWENGERVYVPSLLCRDGYLYGVLDAGIAACWQSDNGKEMWKGRLDGTFSASPVLVGDVIYATNESGETFLYSANSKEYTLLHKNKLGEEVLATPVIVGSRIYYRASETKDGQRQEYLYCIGNPT
jgi:outer membrane protein assembly factor BamB